jgi:hypothetical protein
MRKLSPQAHIVEAVVVTLVLGSLGLAIFDPSIRPRFVDLTEVIAQAYIGRMLLPAAKKKGRR